MKRGIFKVIFVVIIVLIFLNKISALGVMPGRYEINFQPNSKITIPYQVLEDDPAKELSISIDGELAKYAKLSKDKIKGSESFTVTLEFPGEVETPGKNVLYVRVKEKVDDELVEGTVGTSVSIGAAIVIHVPYPGKFLELDLSSNNANVGEPIDFILNVKSKGTDIIVMNPKIKIYSDKNLIETLQFNEREIKSQEEIKLKKTLDTTTYNPGKYKGIAIVDYLDDVAKAEHDFRIGELVIDIINYTDKIKIGGIRAFEINIASGWNNKIDGAYATVSILNETKPIIEFKTDTESLIPWEEKTIVGHFDSTNFEEGIYDANITLIYFGKDQGRSTSEIVKVEFVKETSVVIIASIVFGIILIAGIAFLLWRHFKNGKKKK
ncbi:MAG: hypothetical protein PVJ67_04575 [Candidatus Pacearchaeota archaeon]|jgi:hypothetical protein